MRVPSAELIIHGLPTSCFELLFFVIMVGDTIRSDAVDPHGLVLQVAMATWGTPHLEARQQAGESAKRYATTCCAQST